VNASLIFSPDLATIYGMGKTWDALGSTSTNMLKQNTGTVVRFASNLQSGDGSSDGWAAMGVGYSWPPSAPLNDLSGYGGYGLTIKNTDDDIWHVNIYMNTGWTDAPYSEPDNFYQSTWIELLPGQSASLILDFAAMGVINLNHVTNIGFEVGNDLDAFPINIPANPSNPDVYHVDVSPVPEPATLLLLGLGSLLLARRKHR
jgi:hypothetical protein